MFHDPYLSTSNVATISVATVRISSEARSQETGARFKRWSSAKIQKPEVRSQKLACRGWRRSVFFYGKMCKIHTICVIARLLVL